MIIRYIRDATLQRPVNSRQIVYTKERSIADIEDKQLCLWNSEWTRILNEVPYYRRLQKEDRVPLRFESWDQFRATVPETNRATVRDDLECRTSTSRSAEWHRTTGGTTAQPVRIPSWNDEVRYTRPDMWLGRRWYGIRPADTQFTIWGHGHLLGTGWTGWLNAHKREMSDYFLGYRRFSAYRIGPERMRHAATEMIKFHPKYLVGYSFALDSLARHNADRATELQSLKLKAVIGAAERFPMPDSMDLIASIFGCPVAMEYGSVETGLIAHTMPGGGYQVFWNTYFVEIRKSVESAVGSVLVTSLYPRCFPLVRYELGDEIMLSDGRSAPVTQFLSVVGRGNEFIPLSGENRVHSEAITHAVRCCTGVSAYQVEIHGDTVTLWLQVFRDLSKQELAEIRRRLKLIEPELDWIEVKECRALKQTIAGKTPMVIRT